MTKELISKLRELSDRVFHVDTKPGDFRIIDRAADALAAVPDAATEGRMSLAELEDIAETHAFCADRLYIEVENVLELRDECDAALAAVERVRAIHWVAVDWDGEKTCACGLLDCPTIAALDGAHEPEEKP